MLNETLVKVESIARQAGAIVMDGYGHVGRIRHKGAIDLVTEYDQRSEGLIVAALERGFPGDTIVAEESKPSYLVGSRVWLVDPIDGTTNYAHGYPFFAVSIALAQDGQPTLGVVYDPVRDEMFSAAKGFGATANGMPIHVSEVSSLGDALLATGFPYDVRTNPRNNFREFVEFHLRAQGVRRDGASSLDSAWVAMGRVDGYWEFGIKPWDVAAGAVIAREAGGVASTWDGREDFLTDSSIVISNGRLQREMVELLIESSRSPIR